MSITSLYNTVQKPAAYWQSQARNLVVRGLQHAKQEDDFRRRYYWRALHGFIQGVHREHLERRLAITHPSVSQLWNKDESGHRYFPLIQMYADRLAVVFWRPPETWLHIDGARLPEDDARVRQWRKDEEDCELDTVLQEVERQVIVLGQCLVQPCWVNGRMKYTVHAPYELYLTQSPLDPSSLELAPQVSIELPQPSDSLNAVGESLYSTWRRVDKRDEAGRVVDTAFENYLHDEGGSLRVNPLFPDNINRYEQHPFVVWRGGKKPAAGTFWIPPNIGWYHQQLNADIQQSDLDYIMRYQAHSVAVARGGSDLESFETGPASLIKSQDSEFEFNFVSPDPNLAEMIDAFNFHMRTAAVAESLPPDTWEATSVTRNLAAKQLEQMALKLRRQRVIPDYLRAMRKTFAAHKAVADYWSTQPGVDRVRFGDVELGVSCAPLADAVDRFQDTSALSVEINQLKIDNPIDALMRRHGLPRGEAEKLFERNENFGRDPEEGAAGQVVEVATEAVLNGAQVVAAAGIVEKVAAGLLPRDSGLGMIQILFNLTEQQALKILGAAGTNAFEMAQPDAATSGAPLSTAQPSAPAAAASLPPKTAVAGEGVKGPGSVDGGE